MQMMHLVGRERIGERVGGEPLLGRVTYTILALSGCLTGKFSNPDFRGGPS